MVGAIVLIYPLINLLPKHLNTYFNEPRRRFHARSQKREGEKIQVLTANLIELRDKLLLILQPRIDKFVQSFSYQR